VFLSDNWDLYNLPIAETWDKNLIGN